MIAVDPTKVISEMEGTHEIYIYTNDSGHTTDEEKGEIAVWITITITQLEPEPEPEPVSQPAVVIELPKVEFEFEWDWEAIDRVNEEEEIAEE